MHSNGENHIQNVHFGSFIIGLTVENHVLQRRSHKTKFLIVNPTICTCKCNATSDNVINLRQYILRYTVADPTSLRNVVCHWLTSEYMHLASGFMQLAAAGRRRNIVYLTVFLKGNC